MRPKLHSADLFAIIGAYAQGRYHPEIDATGQL